MLSPVRVTPPAVLPVSLAEAKAHLRVDHDDDDALIDAFLAAATERLDGYSGILGRALITQTWRVDASCWRYPMRLPFGPVQSATIAYWNTANADTEFAPESFSLHAAPLGASIYLNQGYSWPSVYARQDAIRVTFIAGYGDNPEDVPAPIRQAILLMVGAWYANREEAVIGATVASLPMSVGVRALLAPFRPGLL